MKKHNFTRIFAVFLLLCTILFTVACDPQSFTDDLNTILNSFGDTSKITAKTQATPIPKATQVENALQIFYIDVGQGDSILILTPEGHSILIDAGDTSTASKQAIKDCLEKNLPKNSDNEQILDYAIFTHPDADHIGGAQVIMEAFPAKKVILPKKEHTTASYRKMIEQINENDSELIYAKAGTSYTLDSIAFKIIAPYSAEYSDMNNYSVVIHLTYGTTSFLFVGDAETASEKEMLEHYREDLKSDILKVGHHGSDTSSSSEFLAAVQPKYGIVSCGKDNKYGHPTPEILKRYEDAGIPLLRTDLLGTIHLQSDGTNITQVAD